MALRIRLLGRLGIDGDNGVEVSAAELPGRQGRLVLAYLAINRYPVDRDELAQLVWGDDLPRSWERDLSAVISKLKAVLTRAGGPDLLVGSSGSYELRLPAGCFVDVEAAKTFMEKAESDLRAGRVAQGVGSGYAAAELARRVLLPGDEAEWLDARRDEMRAVLGRALDVQAQGHRALGDHREAIRFATRAIEVEPYRESAYVAAMRIHLDSGNRAEALRVYERCRSRLLDDLGVPPGPDAEAAHQEALRADLASGALPLPPPMVVAGRGAFFGRDSELLRLRAGWARALTGEPGMVLLAGDPGIGKTRLLAELAREVHGQGGLVLFGRCDPEPLASFQPFVEALRRWVAGAAPVALRSHGAARSSDLAAVLPELSARLGRVTESAGAPDRLRLYDAVAGLLATVARETPVLLAVDDLHHADRPTLGMLSHLIRAGESAPLLVVATYRNAEPSPDPAVTAFVADLRLDRLAEEIRVPGLDTDAVAALVESETGHHIADPDARAIRDRTAGNPLFVGQLAHADPDAPLPPGVGDAIARHLRRLPAESLAPLTPAAVVGQEFDLDVLEAVADLERDALIDALETAARARVLAHLPGSRRYAFAHPLVRDSLYDALAIPARADLHGRVATVLGRFAPDDAAPLAHHWFQAGEPAAAALHSERAGEQALERLAFEDAISFFDRALELAAGDDEHRRRLLTRRAVAYHGDTMHVLHPQVRSVESS